MSPELTNKLHEKYPDLLNIKIACGDGWYWLIDNLLEKIQQQTNIDINILYIGEKFGVLSIDWDYNKDSYESMATQKSVDKVIWAYISFATTLSSKICEECGSTKYMGKTSVWIKNLCVDCGKKNNNHWTPNEGVMKEIRKDKLMKIKK